MTLAERLRMPGRVMPVTAQEAANELDRLEAELADAKMKLNLIRHIIDRDDVARDRSLSMVPTG